jgi:hypothetical protein
MSGSINDIDIEIRPIAEDHANFMEKSRKLIFGYLFTFLFYTSLFGMAMSSSSCISSDAAESDSKRKCGTAQNISGAYFVYVYIILMPLMIRSFFQLAIIIKKRNEIKKRLQRSESWSAPKETDYGCWWKLIKQTFYLMYYTLKLSYFIIKLFDFRECFWKYQNYTVSSILRWIFQLGITIYCIVINASMISWQLDTNVQIACLVFILARFFAITVYFWQFEVFNFFHF